MQNLRVVITKIDVKVDPAGVVTKNETQYQAYGPDDELIIAGTETDLVREGMDVSELQSVIDRIAYQRWIDYQNNLSRAERIQSTVVDLNVLVNQNITVAVPDIPAEPTIVQVEDSEKRKSDKITITADGETATVETLIEDVSETVADVSATDLYDSTPIEKILGEGDFTVTATAVNVRGGRSDSAIFNFSYTAPTE